MSYRLRNMQLAASSENVFEPITHEISTDSYAPGWFELIAQIDSEGFGKQTVAWRPESLQIFNLETKPDGSGSTYFGHNDVFTEPGSEDFYKIIGLSCLPLQDDMQFSDFVQKQTISLDLISGTWNLEEANTLYAPTSSCNSGTGEDYLGTQDGFTKIINGPISHELENIIDYQSIWSFPDLETLFTTGE